MVRSEQDRWNCQNYQCATTNDGKLGIRVLGLPNGLVTEDPDGFVLRARDATATRRQSRKQVGGSHTQWFPECEFFGQQGVVRS